MISIGIDVGSVAAKIAAYDGEKIIATGLLPTGWSPKGVGEQLLEEILEKIKTPKKKVKSIIGTGYGRVSLPFVDKKITEITCHGRGAYYIDPAIRTVIDIGGQDSKVIKLNSEGMVTDFLMNDKCAAGTGRFLQVMANALEIDIDDLSHLAAKAEPANISSMCTVFAESEVVSLVAEGTPKEKIAAGLLHSVCNKTYSLVNKVGIEDKVFFSGGVSRNKKLGELLEEKLGVKIISTDESQFIGAIGAAILGY
ncbi:acyl-CoA dehydratase activase [Schnuerera sp.]|uniref:acyl-CoA dehydratase activase n=1 Tax=Schnuerera sp. TaxID=2794844 RepID=UPI002C21577F|nr:acyl-CoA dehydratase activase [Schnuerera sp.]HSH36838.1 acyl-CoA dehydratase activase [Schnuerera sp.]